MDSQANLVLEQLAPLLRDTQHLVVLTGAGISAESGLATFRDAMTGLWANYRAEELATPEAFEQNPKLVWDWYAWRRTLAQAVVPNAAHLALVELARLVPQLTIVTQNVDGLHQRAGSANVVELHGSLSRFKCSVDNEPIDPEDFVESPDGMPPRCPRCDAFVRPDIVWFGETLPPSALQTAFQVSRQCDLFFSIGTSGVVEPAASLPYRARDYGATVLYNNLDVATRSEPPLYYLHGKAATILPELLRRAWPHT